MITLEDYWMGRDATYVEELTDEIRGNAAIVVERVNHILEESSFQHLGRVNSGWRPRGVNDRTSNAAKGSKHLSGEAVDLADPGRLFARCLWSTPSLLETCALWMEDPRWTPTWVHLQIVPPGSGRHIFVPSSAPPLAELP